VNQFIAPLPLYSSRTSGDVIPHRAIALRNLLVPHRKPPPKSHF